jgi:branched-chain amino acid transport system ATP-binding protein
MLKLTGLSQRFGGVQVLNGVNLDVPERTIFGLIGPNGAGKTTVFNIITGLLKPSAGNVVFYDQELTHLPPHRITAVGIARTFQNIRVFKEMTLVENVMAGMHDQLDYGLVGLLLNLPGFRRAEARARERALELLSWVGLAERADRLADSLSYGEQRKLELARALATEPKLLLLDEPVAGMNAAETTELMGKIRTICERGYGIFLIEHDMRFVMGLCERIAVLNFGEIIAEGTPDAIKNHPQVIEAYLGKES